ncbi:hypothetical protein BOX15_Mlig026301g1 [Macrostomum lignano]|uniref:Uncharacterized protein n=1 Tax=Macrostomum lignano TaxID=282301 RepID=A0A267FJH7_9PLAT|nr:hypothetical protein BOX15_Mlig026301g1 [Macrostomum lignano]
MLSTTSGFTPEQVQRFRTMFCVLLVGVAILTLGVGILCFGRMYGFDSSRYDLFMVFGVIIVLIATVTITVPVCCQIRIYLEVRKDIKGDESDIRDYAPVATHQMGTGAYIYQQQQQQPQPPPMQHRSQQPFSSAAYIMSQQQQQQQQYPAMQRMDKAYSGSGSQASLNLQQKPF